MLWPGVAEELLASKAWYVSEGVFKDVDVCIFTHVDSNLKTAWGSGSGNGLVSVEYSFKGETAHSAAAPWRGRSAWPQHFNKPVAEAMDANIKVVGLPTWSEADQTLARGIQNEINAPNQKGLDVELSKMDEPLKDEDKRGGGSDDTPPPTWLNTETLERYRAEMKKYYYDPSRYPSYLEQLGINYPTVR